MTINMETQAIARTHKGPGIASFVIGTASVVAVVTLIVTAVAAHQTGKLTPTFTMIVGFGLLSVCFADLIGIGLGVFGVADRTSKKTFPALGVTLNVAMLALFATSVVIGLARP